VTGFLTVFNFALAGNATDTFGTGGVNVGLAGTDLKTAIANIIRIFLGFLGLLAVSLIIYGGFIWMTASGDPSKIEKAKKIITGAVIGLIVILLSFIIVSFVINTFGGTATSPAGSPCNPVGSIENQGTCLTRTCIGDATGQGYWGGWISNCSDPFNDKATYINGFHDDSVTTCGGSKWVEYVNWNDKRTISVPISPSLQVTGFAKNKGGTIIKMDLWSSVLMGHFKNVSTTVEELDDAFYSWNTSPLAIKTTTTLQVKATLSGLGSPIESNFIKTIARPLHCFNCVQDSTETGKDCGDTDCGACPGGSCDIDADCANGVCDLTTHTCAYPPKIDYISPATDPSGNTDFNNSTTWKDDVANGAKENLITIWGSNFGANDPSLPASTGKVQIGTAEANLDLSADNCKSTWNDAQIIARIPNDNSLTVNNSYEVKVCASNGLCSVFPTSTNIFQPNLEINNIVRPGICGATPDHGQYPTTTTIFGLNFPTSGGNVYWGAGASAFTSQYISTWTEKSVIDQVPENMNGWLSIRVKNSFEYSNYFNFLASEGHLGQPCGAGPHSCSNQDNSICVTPLICDKSRDCTCQNPGNITPPPTTVTPEDLSVAGSQATQSFFAWIFTAQTSNIITPVLCGNKAIDAGEDCDGSVPSNATCEKQNLGTGTVACSNQCKLVYDCSGNNVEGQATQSFFAWMFTAQTSNVINPVSCGNGTVESGEDCDGPVPLGRQCADLNLGSGTVTCNQCKLVYNCSDNNIEGQATQSFFAWIFPVGSRSSLVAPKVIEDCNRSKNCAGEQTPSPVPWYESSTDAKKNGWSINNPNNPSRGSITNELACINAVISARFNISMNINTVTTNTIKVLNCGNDKTGASGCSEVPGTISHFSDNNNIADDSFEFIPNSQYDSSTWYKVVLKSSIKSIFGIGIKNETGANGRASDRNCNVSEITDAAYCWNFLTRSSTDSHLICPEGCVECTPDPTNMYYYGDQKPNNGKLDSADNVCLFLNPDDYAWSWSADPTSKVNVTNVTIPQSSSSHQTSTAIGETIFNSPPYAKVIATLVNSRHNDFCKVYNDFTNPVVMEDPNCSSSTIQSPSPWRDSTDACVNAIVEARFSRAMVDSSINASNIIIEKCNDNHGVGCASINSIYFGIGSSIKVFSYSNTDILTQQNWFSKTSDATNNSLAEGFLAIPNNTFKFDKNTWYRVVILGGESGVRGSASTSPSTSDGVLLTRNSMDPALRDRWCYSTGDCSDVASTTQDYYWYFQTGSSTCKINKVAVSPREYFMQFTDESQIYNAIPMASNCNILRPDSYDWNWRSLIDLSEDKNLASTTDSTGQRIATICNQASTTCSISQDIIDPLVRVFGRSEGPVYIKARAKDTAEVGCLWDALCGDKSGSGLLQVGYGNFQVKDYWPKTTVCTNDKIKLYFNMDAKRDSITTNTMGDELNSVMLFKCASTDTNVGDDYCINPANRIPLSITYPLATQPYSMIVEASSTANFATGTKYRVIVKGGSTGAGGTFGILAWNGKQLTPSSLNLYRGSTKIFETCEPGIYPWKDSGTCNASKCIYNTSASLCDKTYKQCDYNTINPSLTPFCSSSCKNAGNNNYASCGNGIIEPGEECDINKPYCSTSTCLLLGSDQRWGSICGNGGTCTTNADCQGKAVCTGGLCLEAGEECDFGINNIATNRCDQGTCLWDKSSYFANLGKGIGTCVTTTNNAIWCDSAKNLFKGSSPKVSVCGNGTVETGEDCDLGRFCNDTTSTACKIDSDCSVGVNCISKAKNGCGANCLATGSTGVADPAGSNLNKCGNDLVEQGANQAFSWIFDVADTASVCKPVTIELAPCPNSIWRVSINDQQVQSATISIDRAYRENEIVNFISNGGVSSTCATTTQTLVVGSFWQKIVNKFKTFVAGLFGHSAMALTYWCPVSSKTFTDVQKLPNSYKEINPLTESILNPKQFEIVGYRDYSANKYVFNYIPTSTNLFDYDTNYRMRVEYKYAEMDQINTIQSSIRVFATNTPGLINNGTNYICPVNEVSVDLWPAGQNVSKTSDKGDHFFCDGDKCGQGYDDVYLNDQNYATSGNQHLYRAWGVNTSTGNSISKYLIKTSLNWDVTQKVPSDLNLEKADFNVWSTPTNPDPVSTDYTGDQWLTLKPYRDKDVSNIYGLANVDIDAHTLVVDSEATTTVPVTVFMCNNPWPNASVFPFVDQASNCTLNPSTCPNTNFKTYYCRDKGAPGPADDLPSIGKYNVVNNNFGAVIGSAFANLRNTTSTGSVKEFLLLRGYDPKYIQENMNGYFGVNVNNQVSFVPGKVGQAAQFKHKEEQEITVALTTGLSNYMTSSFSVSAWVNSASQVKADGELPDSNGRVIANAYNITNADGWILGSMGIKRQLYFIVSKSSNTVLVEYSDFFKKYKNQWVKVTGVFVPSTAVTSGSMTLYINGSAVASTTVSGISAIDYVTVPNFTIGHRSDKPNEGMWDGLIDEVKIYNRALSAGEISNDKNTDGLVAYYPLDTPTGEAIGIRVANNPFNYSALSWYRHEFSGGQVGTPSPVVVDGYQATQEGRTVYVAGADLEPGGTPKIYGTSYLISYTGGASADLQNIFGQMVRYFHLNVGTKTNGGLENTALGTCSLDPTQSCYIDRDCLINGWGYCTSDKAKLTRETNRLGDIQDVNLLLTRYFTQKRCSNDQTKLCYDDSSCSSGKCGNFFPVLNSGTFISGRSYSTWPSWQATLGNALGSALPLDPINKFSGCSNPFNPATCWNETTKSMAPPTQSNVYAYCPLDVSAGLLGQASGVYTQKEFNGTYTWAVSASFNPGNVLLSDYSAINTACSDLQVNCGNGKPDLPLENCTNCLKDVCAKGQVCDVSNPANPICKAPTNNSDWDGDGENNSADPCPYNASRTSLSPRFCGCGGQWGTVDGTTVLSVVIDSKGTTSTVSGTSGEPDSDADGHPDCVDKCPKFSSKWQSEGICGCLHPDSDFTAPTATFCNKCGDSTVNGSYCTNNNYNNPTDCYTNGAKWLKEQCDDGNRNQSDGCNDKCQVESGWSCVGTDPSVCTPSCGDGKIVGGETCDDSNAKAGDGCSDTCQIESGWVCDGPSGRFNCRPLYGDCKLVGPEQCDSCQGATSSTPISAGNLRTIEGCTNDRRIVYGWTCNNAKLGNSLVVGPNNDSLCTPVCGDGVAVGPEANANGVYGDVTEYGILSYAAVDRIGSSSPAQLFCDASSDVPGTIIGNGDDPLQKGCTCTTTTIPIMVNGATTTVEAKIGVINPGWQCRYNPFFNKDICKPVMGDCLIVGYQPSSSVKNNFQYNVGADTLLPGGEECDDGDTTDSGYDCCFNGRIDPQCTCAQGTYPTPGNVSLYITDYGADIAENSCTIHLSNPSNPSNCYVQGQLCNNGRKESVGDDGERCDCGVGDTKNTKPSGWLFYNINPLYVEGVALETATNGVGTSEDIETNNSGFRQVFGEESYFGRTFPDSNNGFQCMSENNNSTILNYVRGWVYDPAHFYSCSNNCRTNNVVDANIAFCGDGKIDGTNETCDWKFVDSATGKLGGLKCPKYNIAAKNVLACKCPTGTDPDDSGGCKAKPGSCACFDGSAERLKERGCWCAAQTMQYYCACAPGEPVVLSPDQRSKCEKPNDGFCECEERINTVKKTVFLPGATSSELPAEMACPIKNGDLITIKTNTTQKTGGTGVNENNFQWLKYYNNNEIGGNLVAGPLSGPLQDANNETFKVVSGGNGLALNNSTFYLAGSNGSYVTGGDGKDKNWLIADKIRHESFSFNTPSLPWTFATDTFVRVGDVVSIKNSINQYWSARWCEQYGNFSNFGFGWNSAGKCLGTNKGWKHVDTFGPIKMCAVNDSDCEMASDKIANWEDFCICNRMNNGKEGGCCNEVTDPPVNDCLISNNECRPECGDTFAGGKKNCPIRNGDIITIKMTVANRFLSVNNRGGIAAINVACSLSANRKCNVGGINPTDSKAVCGEWEQFKIIKTQDTNILQYGDQIDLKSLRTATDTDDWLGTDSISCNDILANYYVKNVGNMAHIKNESLPSNYPYHTPLGKTQPITLKIMKSESDASGGDIKIGDDLYFVTMTPNEDETSNQYLNIWGGLDSIKNNCATKNNDSNEHNPCGMSYGKIDPFTLQDNIRATVCNKYFDCNP